ncbi:MAG: 50S ribosomal protein L1, partial [Bacteroidetes bacterium]|nr:50S ribosomal protein L1 [Bacteroidota bacterium]
MTKISKNRKLAMSKYDATKSYSLAEATKIIKDITNTKFDSSVDVSVRLGVDPRKANQMVRGS